MAGRLLLELSEAPHKTLARIIPFGSSRFRIVGRCLLYLEKKHRVKLLQYAAADPANSFKLRSGSSLCPQGGFPPAALSVDISPSSGRSCASRTSSQRSRR